MTETVTGQELRQFIERVERIETEIKDGQDARKEVYAEAKSRGFDVAVMKDLVKLRKKDADDVSEHDAILDTYKSALGMS